MDNQTFGRRFFNQMEFLVSTFFIPIGLISEGMALPYKDLSSPDGLKPFYAMGVLFIVEFALWVLKEYQGQLKKEEIKHFHLVKNMFYYYSIYALIMASVSVFSNSILCSFWLMMMSIGFIAKYQLLKRVDNKLI